MVEQQSDRSFSPGETASPMDVRVKREQVRYGFARLYNALVVTPAGGLVLAVLFWPHVRHVWLILWLLLIVGVTVGRYLLQQAFFRVAESDFDTAKWKKIVILQAAIGGMVWAASAFLIFPDSSVPHQALLTLIIAGLCAGNTVSNSSVLFASTVFTTLSMLPVTARFAMLGTPIHYGFTFMSCLYVVMMWLNARQNNQMILSAIRLKFENADLVAYLASAKQKAEEVAKMKDRFVALASHDLRSPIASIHSFMDLLLSGRHGMDEAQRGRLMTQIIGTTQGMLTMIDQLLDIARVSTGVFRPIQRRVSVRNLCQHKIEALHLAAETKGIRIENRVPEQMFLLADPGLLGEVMQNLLANAVKFSLPGGVVKVFVPDDAAGTVAVCDTGVGIPPAILPDLFRQEVKTSTPGTAGEKGSGLGLPYCYEIVKAHGGNIRVRSAPGEGTVFYVDIPMEGPVVIVADDQEANRAVVKNLLRANRNVRIIEAVDGQEALDAAMETAPSLVITDIGMPVMGGLELLICLRNSPSTKTLPVLVMTSENYHTIDGSPLDIRKRAMDLGASDFIQKPIAPDEFYSRIKRLL